MSGVLYQGGPGRKSGRYALAGFGVLASDSWGVEGNLGPANASYVSQPPVRRWKSQGANDTPHKTTTVSGLVAFLGTHLPSIGYTLDSFSFLIGAASSLTTGLSVSRNFASTTGLRSENTSVQRMLIGSSGVKGQDVTAKGALQTVVGSAGVRLAGLTTLAGATLFTNIEGATGILSQSAYRKGARMTAVSRIGVLGENTMSAADLGPIVYVEMTCGVLGTNTTVKGVLGSLDVEQIMDAIIEYDANGDPIKLRIALQAILAALLGRTDGFERRGTINPRKFKSMDGNIDRISGQSADGGERMTDPTINGTDL